MSIGTALNVGLSLAGWFFIMLKTGEFFIGLVLSQLVKRRKRTRREKALEEFYDAYELGNITPGTATMIPMTGKLEVTVIVQRKGSAIDADS